VKQTLNRLDRWAVQAAHQLILTCGGDKVTVQQKVRTQTPYSSAKLALRPCSGIEALANVLVPQQAFSCYLLSCCSLTANIVKRKARELGLSFPEPESYSLALVSA
jgi:NifU-like protein involved in Fe-S cluster formation